MNILSNEELQFNTNDKRNTGAKGSANVYVNCHWSMKEQNECKQPYV